MYNFVLFLEFLSAISLILLVVLEREHNSQNSSGYLTSNLKNFHQRPKSTFFDKLLTFFAIIFILSSLYLSLNTEKKTIQKDQYEKIYSFYDDN